MRSVEWLLLFVGLVAGYLLGRWRRDRWARARIAEIEQTWGQKLKRGDEAFLARLRLVETELEIMRTGGRASSGRPPAAVEVDADRGASDPDDVDPAGSTRLRSISEVMRGRPYSTSGDSTIEAPSPEQDDGEQAARDDLTQLRGIGPKTADHLAAAGVRTYSQLAALTPDDVKQILADGGFGVASADPESWPAQATLAAEGRWLALRALQAASRR